MDRTATNPGVHISPRPGFFARRNVIAIAISAFATGPTFLSVLIAWARTFPTSPELGPIDVRDVYGLALVTALASIYGLVAGLPAAILNSVLQLSLLKYGIASALIGALSGAILGASFGYVAISLFAYDSRYGIRFEIMCPLGIGGMLIGLLYWFIAIKRHRLHHVPVPPKSR